MPSILIENNDNDNSLDKKSPFNFIGPGSSQEDSEPLYNSDHKDKENFSPISKDNPLKEIVILRISQISYYISQKKKENKELEDYQNILKDDIKKLQIQKNILIERFNQIIRKEKFVISYLNFFKKLKKELWEKHSIKIDDDIQNFSYFIHDFKERAYDANEIIKEYLKSISLKAQIITNEA